jgi:chemotaxis protein methyltransferase CheR
MTVAAVEFEYLQKLVFERSAIVLSADKGYLIETRLMPIVKDLGLASIDDVIAKARRTKDRPLEDKLVEAMTTNETLWLRDVHPFNALRRTVVPEILARKAATKQLSIWSAACSSGQEPYSISLVLAEDFPQLSGWRVDVLGTDLSTEVIAKAREGLYSKLEMNRGLPATMLIKYFKQEGIGFRLNDEVRKRVRFKAMNLAGPWPAMGKFDVIMLRNVLIYFDTPTKQKILAAAANCLSNDGYLFLGSAETMYGICDLYRSETADGATFYRLKGHP